MIDVKMKTFMEKLLKVKSTDLLKFSHANSKLDNISTFSLPAGHSCPFAKDCRSCATLKNKRTTGNIKSLSHKPCGFGIQDGPHTQFRCFTAIDEVMKPNVRKSRWHNFLLLQLTCKKGIKAVADLIEKSLPPANFGIPIRVHVAGDFFNQTYFDAWMEVARRNSNRLFYAYTKALPFWVKRIENIPNNFRLTASKGGTHDWMIESYGLRSAIVVKSVEEAKQLGLEIDHDDSHAYGNGGDFALLVHGQQPAGSVWAKAWSSLKMIGMGGYGKQKKNYDNHK